MSVGHHFYKYKLHEDIYCRLLWYVIHLQRLSCGFPIRLYERIALSSLPQVISRLQRRYDIEQRHFDVDCERRAGTEIVDAPVGDVRIAGPRQNDHAIRAFAELRRLQLRENLAFKFVRSPDLLFGAASKIILAHRRHFPHSNHGAAQRYRTRALKKEADL
jgi:hypothetical protein